MKKVYIGAALLLIFVCGLFVMSNPKKSQAEIVHLDGIGIDDYIMAVLQLKQEDIDSAEHYFVDLMLESCGLKKKWISQLPRSEKKQFYNAEAINYYSEKIAEDEEIRIIIARFLLDEKVYRYHMAICFSMPEMINKQNDRIWISVPGFSDSVLPDNPVFLMNQWFVGDKVHGKTFYDVTQEQSSSIMKKFDLEYQGFYQNFYKKEIDQCVFYLSCEFVRDLRQEERETVMPFVIYYQPDIKRVFRNGLEIIEAPKLENVTWTSMMNQSEGIQNISGDGWIGVGVMP